LSVSRDGFARDEVQIALDLEPRLVSQILNVAKAHEAELGTTGFGSLSNPTRPAASAAQPFSRSSVYWRRLSDVTTNWRLDLS
jgi:hypothetical protein